MRLMKFFFIFLMKMIMQKYSILMYLPILDLQKLLLLVIIYFFKNDLRILFNWILVKFVI